MQNSFLKDAVTPETWQPLLETERLGRSAHYEHTVDSTNVRLRQLALSGAPHGTVCLCECQTAGRGRLGRSWHSPEGCGLWVSVLLRPSLRTEQAPVVTLLTAMAMQRAVNALMSVDCRIKWPNDLVLGGKKLCGVLLEVSADQNGLHHIVTGTGLNVHAGAYPPELAHQATALCEHGTPPERGAVLARYLLEMERLLTRLETEGFDGIAAEYASASCTLGQRVRVTGGMELTGTAKAIDNDGALLVCTDDGALTRVLAGDVSVRGVMGYV